MVLAGSPLSLFCPPYGRAPVGRFSHFPGNLDLRGAILPFPVLSLGLGVFRSVCHALFPGRVFTTGCELIFCDGVSRLKRRVFFCEPRWHKNLDVLYHPVTRPDPKLLSTLVDATVGTARFSSVF